MNCELVVFVIFCQLCCIMKFDIFTDCILDSDRYRCIFRTNFRFRCFRNTDIVSVSGVTVFDFVSDKNMKTVMVLVFTDSFRPFSSLAIGPCRHGSGSTHAVPCSGTTGRAVLRTDPISPALFAIYRRK
jgi:NADH:ubiquinone oxidoreductase subunit B-like Fe-S oxidoreductase